MYLSILLSFTIALVLSSILMPVVIKLSNHYNWVDYPAFRKIHENPIPSLGGIGIYISFWVVGLIFCSATEILGLHTLLAASWLLFVTSLWDDLYNASPYFRLFIQILVGTICYFGGVKIMGLYGLYGIYEVGPLLQYILTVLAIVTIVNAYNLIDGINGLAGSLAVFSLTAFSLLFWSIGLNSWSILSMIGVAAVLGFLKFNFGAASVFMGDNGSTFIGLLLSFFFIQYINVSTMIPLVGFKSLPIGLGVIALPVLDLMRVSLFRMLKGKSPFSPDQSHIHHLLINGGRSHSHTSIMISILQGSLFIIGYLLLPFYSTATILSILICIYTIAIIAIQLSLSLTHIKSMETDRLSIGKNFGYY